MNLFLTFSFMVFSCLKAVKKENQIKTENVVHVRKFTEKTSTENSLWNFVWKWEREREHRLNISFINRLHFCFSILIDIAIIKPKGI